MLTREGQQNYDEIFGKKKLNNSESRLKTMFSVPAEDFVDGTKNILSEIKRNIIIMETYDSISACCDSFVDVIQEQCTDEQRDAVIIRLYYKCRNCNKECEVKK